MKTKLIALLLLAVLAFSLASCSFFGGGEDPATTTTTQAPATTTTAIKDPIRTEPPKVTTAAPQPAIPGSEWSDTVK